MNPAAKRRPNPWPLWVVALAAATGYALFFLISKYVHHVCPACAASHFDEDTTRHFSEIATALIVALAIHSTTDGLALGIGREIHAATAAKWSLFLALCIHKFPEGFALGSLFDTHIFEFAGFKDFAAFQAFHELGVFFAAHDLHAGMLALFWTNLFLG